MYNSKTDRLSQMIDGKRGVLVEAIGAKPTSWTPTSTASLRSAEIDRDQGQGFSQSMRPTVRRRAHDTNAGELATGAVSKSLKDLELASRAAIDQSARCRSRQ